ncbi:MAG: 2-oxoglutarate dehydrogenase E1 component [Gemmatimonadota bacterium]|nr:2-oxoglutarate dehydrogenase E1 component [Gemmatimonadota bacterium]
MSTLPIVSAFNDGYIAEQYETYRRDPGAVDGSWRQFFRFAESLGGGSVSPPADTPSLRKVAGAAGLVQAIRQHGHFAVPLDPLGTAAGGAAELTATFHGITDDDLAAIPGSALGFGDSATAADAVDRLRRLYSSSIGFEFEHLADETEREWFREMIERGTMRRALTPDEKVAALRRLTQVDALERFLGRAYQGAKRFSIEGTDAMVPMMEAAIEGAAQNGARDIVIGMAHRGRINVLAHILHKPYATIFDEFAGKHAATNAASDTGDVKYHLGARTEWQVGEQRIVVHLVPNPSHLEFVNPVVEGVSRALQRTEGNGASFDGGAVLPILVHGDAAFPGEGIVPETLNLSRLRGFSTGGTLHIIANNQVGFTTDPADGRSTYYASDLAKGFEIPIVHVNGDDVESCLAAVWLGLAYRERFGRDFLIDVVGYRRHGHNETDEPAFTQPILAAAIKAHPSPREVWGNRLAGEGVITAEEVRRLDGAVMGELERIHDELRTGDARSPEHVPGDQSAAVSPAAIDTALPAEQLAVLNDRVAEWPADFQPLPKLGKQLQLRRAALAERKQTDLGERGRIDWGHAEALAFASLLVEGISIRLSGQDAERGTFSHRQAVLHDHRTGATYTPLQHVPGARGLFEIYNSSLSESAVMGFEYGYSVAAEDALVLWEAQFGDFANVSQPIIDQFLAADRAKWGQNSGLVLLLPHGYEGQGPEHSSARLERFLQLCAEGNLRVANPSTPAQYFHILRRQARDAARRPLVLMQPKSLLRLPEAASRLEDLATGSFQPVVDDDVTAARAGDVRRLVFCSGKVYYDIATQRHDARVALVRVDELSPWPHEAIGRIIDRYSGVTEIAWAQEEPKNMGAWMFVAPRLRAAAGNAIPVRYIGRPERASPAEGYAASHQAEQGRIVSEVLAVARDPALEQRTAAAASR